MAAVKYKTYLFTDLVRHQGKWWVEVFSGVFADQSIDLYNEDDVLQPMDGDCNLSFGPFSTLNEAMSFAELHIHAEELGHA